MTDPTDLLSQIIVRPEDDDLRLVYADALDEAAGRETDRARLIRLQISQLRTARPVPEITEVLIRFDEFLVNIGAVGATARFNPEIRRGFAEEVTCTWADWVRHGDAIAWHPSMLRQCRNCCGTGGNIEWNDACPACSGTGNEHYPCPDTAHPVRKVTITDEVHFTHFRDDAKAKTVTVGLGVSVGDDEILMNIPNWAASVGVLILSRRWPGVKFVANRTNLHPR